MKYIVYIICNQHGKKYIGHSSNFNLRLQYHNNNKSFYTKNKGPWKLIYKEIFQTRSEAMKREKFLKKQKGGDTLKNIIKHYSL